MPSALRPGTGGPDLEGDRVTEVPGSPRAARLSAPRWLDARLGLGVLLVLTSVVGGARLLSAADRTELVWAAARDLAPGVVLGEGDLVQQEVGLVGGEVEYLAATGATPVGNVVQRGLLAGELVPRRALQAPERVQLRQVTVGVRAGHAPPDLRRGQVVDVYVTPVRAPSAAATPTAGSRLVLPDVTVVGVPEAPSFSAGADTRAIVLSVPRDEVLGLVQAVTTGDVDLVRLPGDALGAPGTRAAAR